MEKGLRLKTVVTPSLFTINYNFGKNLLFTEIIYKIQKRL